MPGRDIIVVGASAGGIEAVSDLLVQLPADLKASVFIVIHVSPDSPNLLPEIFQRRSALTCTLASDGQKIQAGIVYIAPADLHLTIKDSTVTVTKGPKENRARPAIDPLFRSAAIACGARVIGIILSGLLDDGVSGLNSIKKCGGIAIAQEPDDAMFPDMPRNALASVEVDYHLPVSRMGALLTRLINEDSIKNSGNAPKEIEMEVKIAQKGVEHDNEFNNNTVLQPDSMVLTCPECNGPLIEVKDSKILRFRCITGHAYTAENLLVHQKEVLEAALFAALRILQERANMLERMCRETEASGSSKALADMKQKSADARQYAGVIRNLVLGRNL